MTDTHDYIGVGLPIPVDVFGTLGSLIDKAWPGSTIIADMEAAQVPPEVRARFRPSLRGDMVLLRIPKRAPQRVSKKVAQETADAHVRDTEATEPALDFLGFDSDEDQTWVRMAPPEELCRFLGAIGNRILEGVEGAVNYVEWECIDGETYAGTVLSVARSKGQTPGALRKKAEARVERLERALNVALAHARGEVDCAPDERAEELEGARMVLAGEA